ncbi:UDP-glucose 4-epimerase GalE [bacterium]|nr:UDP-glucose 4-epimerase GalE [bacterium]
MNVLVTGGAGYIGSVTVERLIEKGYKVFVVDSLENGHIEAVHPEAEFFQCNIGAQNELDRIIKSCQIEAILHFAAYALVGESMENPGKYFQNNVFNAHKLIQAAVENKIKKFILSSTCATYGEPSQVPIPENHPTNPTNPYGESKLMLEKVLKWYHKCHGLEYVALRYFNACGASPNYGEDHEIETHLIPIILEVACGQRELIKIFGDDYPTADGTCIRDYIHIIDLADAHILALDVKGSKTYNLGTGKGYSVKEVIDCVEQVTGRKIKTKLDQRRSGDPAQLVAVSETIKNELGWKPIYNMEKIIQSAWKWKLTNPKGYNKN